MLLALKRMGDDYAWGESVLRSAVTLREAGVDVIEVLRTAGNTDECARETGPQSVPVSIGAAEDGAERSDKPHARNSGTAAGGEPGAGRGPLKPSGGAPEPPAGVWAEDPAKEGPFTVLLQTVTIDVATRNPNFHEGSRHPARAKKFLFPKDYAATYAEQHRWITAAGGQLPAGWVLPAGTKMTPDGHCSPR